MITIQWGLGSAIPYTSTGTTVIMRWGLGSVYVRHEYIEKDNALAFGANF